VPLLCAVAPLQAMPGQDVATLCASVASIASSLTTGATLPAEVDTEPSPTSGPSVSVSTVRKKKKDPRVRGKQVQGVFCTIIDSYE
jgi:hypothetical protein